MEVEYFRLFFVFLVAGLVDFNWKSLNFPNAQILKKRCNFTLRWLLDLRNTSLEQNLRLKTLDYLLFIPTFFICSLAAPWLTFAYYRENSLTHLMSLTLHLGYQFLVQRWLGGFGSLLLIQCPLGFVHNDITHLPTHPKLQKILSQDLHPIFTKCGNAPNAQAVIAWHCSGL